MSNSSPVHRPTSKAAVCAKNGNADDCEVNQGEGPVVPALTFSRGTRPLVTRRVTTHGSQHSFRRRSA